MDENQVANFSFKVAVKDKVDATNFTLVSGIMTSIPNGECGLDSCATEVLVARDLDLSLSANEVEQHKAVDYTATLYYGNGTAHPKDVTDSVTLTGVTQDAPEDGKIVPSQTVSTAKAEMDQVYTDLAGKEIPTPPSTGLPVTGAAAGSLVGIAALLTIAGAYMVLRSRREKEMKDASMTQQGIDL